MILAMAATLGLSAAAVSPAAGQYVLACLFVANNGQEGGDFTLTAALVNLANGNTEAHFYASPPGAGAASATGTVAGQSQQVVTMYAPISATAADIGGYVPAQGLAIVASLNGTPAVTVQMAVFLAGTTGAQALEITGVQAAWQGQYMGATVTLANPSANTGQAVLHRVVLIGGSQRDAYGYVTVTVGANATGTVNVLTGGPVSPEFDGQVAIPQFELLIPGTGTPIGQPVDGPGLVVGQDNYGGPPQGGPNDFFARAAGGMLMQRVVPR